MSNYGLKPQLYILDDNPTTKRLLNNENDDDQSVQDYILLRKEGMVGNGNKECTSSVVAPYISCLNYLSLPSVLMSIGNITNS